MCRWSTSSSRRMASKAADAAELVTKPLEEIVKGIPGVEHVYSQTQDDRVMVTARFLTGTSEDDAILRVQAKMRANYDRIPLGIPEPLIVGTRHQRCRDRGRDPVAQTPGGGALDRKRSLCRGDQAPGRTGQGRRCRADLYIGAAPRRRSASSPTRKNWRFSASRCSSWRPRSRAPTVPSWRANCARAGGWCEAVAGQTLDGIPDIGLLLVTTRDGRPVYVRDLAKIVIEPAPRRASCLVDDPKRIGLERPRPP